MNFLTIFSKKELDLRKDSIPRLFFSYFLPAFCAMMAMATYSVIDGIFVGQKLGSSAMAAIGVSWAIFPAMAAFHLLFGVGAASIASYYLGKNEPGKARVVFNSVAFFAFISSVIIGVVCFFFCPEIARILGASSAIEPMAVTFMGVFFLALPVMILHPILDIFAINDRRQVLAMVSMLVVAALNIALNYLFLFVLEVGIIGSALATILAHFVGIAILLPHFLRLGAKNKNAQIYFELKFSAAELFKGAKNGVPQSVSELGVAAVISLFNHRLFALGGDYAVSIYAVIMYSGIVLFHTMLAVAQGIQPLSSFNYGAALMERVRSVFRFGLFFALGAGIVCYALAFIFDEHLVALFLRGEHKETLLADAALGIRIHFLQYVSLGVCMVASVFYQTLQKPLNSFVITISYSLVFVLIALYGASYFWGVLGVWMAWPLSCFGGMLVALGISYYEFKFGVLRR